MTQALIAYALFLAEAATMVENSNDRAGNSIVDRSAMLESLVSTIDMRTHDLDDRLSRFTSLLDDSLAAAETRARDIAQIVGCSPPAPSDSG